MNEDELLKAVKRGRSPIEGALLTGLGFYQIC